MNKETLDDIITYSIIIVILGMVFILGFSAGRNNGKEKLEQKLCKLEQYKYCNEEEKLKIIEKQLLKK